MGQVMDACSLRLSYETFLECFSRQLLVMKKDYCFNKKGKGYNLLGNNIESTISAEAIQSTPELLGIRKLG